MTENEKKEREELLIKIKESIKNNKKDVVIQATLDNAVVEKKNDINVEEVIENVKKNINYEKVNKAKSLNDLFNDPDVKKMPDMKRKMPAHIRNINLGNVYDKQKALFQGLSNFKSKKEALIYYLSSKIRSFSCQL